jgi:hypothetical protein
MRFFQRDTVLSIQYLQRAFTELLDIINELFFTRYFVAETAYPNMFVDDYRHAFIISLPDFQTTHLPGRNPSPPMQWLVKIRLI